MNIFIFLYAMKYLILPIVLWIVFLSTYYKSSAVSMVEMTDEINKVEKDYQKEYWKQNCKIKWIDVSLGAVMYALAIQEWWWKDGTLWDKTNNRWSLHWTMNIKKPVKFIKADSSKTRPVYTTAYDWLYEKAWMITNKKVYNNCDIWYKQLFAYIVWPNANPNKLYSWNKKYTNSQRVTISLNKLLSNAQQYNKTETKVQKWFNPKCKKISILKDWQYIQIDNKNWEMKNKINIVWSDKLFICN